MQALTKTDTSQKSYYFSGATPLTAINSLTGRYREVIRMSALGIKAEEIALKIGMTVSHIRAILATPLAKDHLSKLMDVRDAHAVDISTQIAEIAPLALERVKEMLQKGSGTAPPVVLNAAKDILDRAGYSPVRRVQAMTARLTSEDIAALNERARLAGIDLAPETENEVVENACMDSTEARES